MSRDTQEPLKAGLHFHIRGCHPLWPAFPGRSINTHLTSFNQGASPAITPVPPPDYCGPTTPDFPFESSCLGYSEFARHYYRNHFCFLFLWVLRWFTSPGSLPDPMYSDQDKPCVHGLDFSIRKSPDHRLLASPRSLSQLATSFIASLRQGILTHALSSLTIKFTPNTIFKTFYAAHGEPTLPPNNTAVKIRSRPYRVCYAFI